MDINQFNAAAPLVQVIQQLRACRAILADPTFAPGSLGATVAFTATTSGQGSNFQAPGFTSPPLDATVTAAYVAFLEAMDTSFTALLAADGVTA